MSVKERPHPLHTSTQPARADDADRGSEPFKANALGQAGLRNKAEDLFSLKTLPRHLFWKAVQVGLFILVMASSLISTRNPWGLRVLQALESFLCPQKQF